MKDLNIIVLIGGSGERVSSLSDNKLPKQFINIYNQYSLFSNTIQRHLFLNAHFTFITNQIYLKKVQDEIKKLKLKNYTLLIEPVKKNTLAAICLATFFNDQFKQVLVLPSDHFIENEESYRSCIQKMLSKDSNNFKILGVPASFPSTQYGYIKTQGTLFKEFIEKPNKEEALLLIENKDIFFNCGIFNFTPATLKNQISPQNPLIKIAKEAIKKDVNTYFFNEKQMRKLENISFDKAILEKTKNIQFFTGNFQWSDLGSFEEILKILPQEHPLRSKINCKNSKNE